MTALGFFIINIDGASLEQIAPAALLAAGATTVPVPFRSLDAATEYLTAKVGEVTLTEIDFADGVPIAWAGRTDNGLHEVAVAYIGSFRDLAGNPVDTRTLGQTRQGTPTAH